MVVPLAQHDGKWMTVHWFPAGAEKAVRWFYTVPGVGPLVLAGIATTLVAAVLFALESRDGKARNAFKVAVAGFTVLGGALAFLVYKLSVTTAIQPPAELLAQFVPASRPPFRLSVGSNYSLGLLATAWGAIGMFLLVAWRREAIEAKLPSVKALDEMAYKVVIIAFPLISIGIVMGAMWAYDAWGRYWGWDPKETWALITWAIYAVYLHVRITYGAGSASAGISVFAFGVVVFTYMGVNLGLTGEGLHVYGQS